MAAESEKIYECQVKRRRLKIGGGYEPFWKLKSVAEALVDDDTEFRCSDCTGAVRLHRRHLVDAPPPLHRPQAQNRLRVLPRRHLLPQSHRRPSAPPLRAPRPLTEHRHQFRELLGLNHRLLVILSEARSSSFRASRSAGTVTVRSSQREFHPNKLQSIAGG